MDLMVEASPRRVFANAHTYHINSISVNSDCETYLSADDLRVNLWHLEITDRSFSILSFFNSIKYCNNIKLFCQCFVLFIPSFIIFQRSVSQGENLKKMYVNSMWNNEWYVVVSFKPLFEEMPDLLILFTCSPRVSQIRQRLCLT